MRKRSLGRSILTIILALVMVIQMAAPGQLAFAAVSDRDTSTKYTESLGDNMSTEYAGRVWTDKSVFDTDVTFDTYGGGSVTVKLDGDADEDFLISYSALATAQSISGQSQSPVDVVLILDISGSMSNGNSNMDNGKSRIYNTVQAANEAIDSLMEMNEYNRVAVAVFSSNAQVLLPLSRYEKTTSTERQWVQTGSNRWDGYWQNVTVDVPYFTLNREVASSEYAVLTTKAIDTATQRTVSETTDVEGGTNIQMGLYEGMQVLAQETVTTANIGGATVQRAPSVILLSDGSPTYSSNSSSWWAPSDNHNDGPGSAPYAGNGMKAILVGSYMKAAIDRNYKVAGTAYATTVYTVGMGITGLSDDEKDLAYMTLDTGTYWEDTSVTNDMKTAIKDYWSSYTANNNTGTLNINVGRYVDQRYSDKNYALTHPTTGYDVDPLTGYDYVDDYYGADNASAVTDVFHQIVANIAISAPQVPTEIKGEDPLTDGYITYTDPIGKYMEVKDVKSIIYAGTEFTSKAVTVSGSTTTYTFSGAVHSPVYGDQEITNILIKVTEDAQGNETLTVQIPASVIPLRVNEVTLNNDGSVKTHTNNGAFPTRVVYSVGLKDGVKQTSDDGHEYVDTSVIDADYLAQHTDAEGNVSFYSNVYTGSKTVNGYTAGDATVEFEPAHTNPFYYIQKDMPIYKDREFTQPVTEEDGLADDQIYYYKEEYYHGSSVEVKAIARTGVQLKRTSIVTGTDGNLYREAGSPRLNRILEFEGTKVENATGTAQDFYAPTFELPAGSTDPFDGKFVIYLGNNGVLSLPAGGNLQISKAVAAAAGLTAPGKSFTFTIDLDGSKINGGSYKYEIVDDQQQPVSTGTVSRNNNTITLTDGQIATIYSLPPMTTYTITEAGTAGFAQESEGATGTIHAGQTQQAKFTNTYSVTEVTSQTLKGTKILSGRAWGANDSFTFFLSPYNDCPLPVGYDAAKGVTVTAPDAAGGAEATFEFGEITFTAPGIYRYTVAEKEPENDSYLPGMTYSRALFRIYFEVVDNGDGTLSIADSSIQRLYDDSANQLFTYDSNDQIVMNSGEEAQDAITFTNTYTAASVTRVPTAIKAYTDASGTNPLVSGMFQFQLKALGYKVDGGELITDITNVPMPAGSQNGVVITTNEGHNITFPAVEFTQSLIPAGAASITYRYEMSEVIPASKVPGMTYDDSTYTIDVVVTVDGTSHELKVSAIYPNDERIATFTNRYDLEPVTAEINGTKTLSGRDMLTGETFAFSLVGANAATNNAVRDGYVVVPSSEATVQNGKDGQPVAFTFRNIRFERPGTYSFLVSETAGSAAAVLYDASNITVTFQVADTNGDAKLEIVSTTYSNGKSSADFVNTYTYTFTGTPVSLEGTKNLTGKSLLEGEFFFLVKEHYNGSYVSEKLVSHAADATADKGVYTGKILFLQDVTYQEAGTYTYYITEQIPDDDHKVSGTTYDAAKYRCTVVVTDDLQGNLTVTSKTLEKADGSAWKAAENVVFSNTYAPEATTVQLPLIKKVISGDRNAALKDGEFSFEMKLVSADPTDGIKLPSQTVVGNAENGDIIFDYITFTKAGTYIVSVEEVIPADAQKVPGITYSTQLITAVFRVTDNRNGVLTALMTQFEGGDSFINSYSAKPAQLELTAQKSYEKGLTGGDFTFLLTGHGQNQEKTNNAQGLITFDSIELAETGTYTFTITEQAGSEAWIKYDDVEYKVTVEVKDDGKGQLYVDQDTIICTADGVAATDILFDNDYILKEGSVVISGKKQVTRDGQAQALPAEPFTFGLYENGTLIQTTTSNSSGDFAFTVEYAVAGEHIYTVKEIAPAQRIEGMIYDDAEYQVKVQVEDEGQGNLRITQSLLTGSQILFTNTVHDILVKDVAQTGKPEISIDGQKVQNGQSLTYTITYTNTTGKDVTATITDTLPAYTKFVSATNGGTCTGGVTKWVLNVQKDATVTVSVTVQVQAGQATLTNKATVFDGTNTYGSNEVENTAVRDEVVKDVAYAATPEISIDGQKVEKNDVLQYKITYTNRDDFTSTVTITDLIPENTTYVAGSADNGGIYASGKLTWTLSLAAGQSKTVSFQVKVTGTTGTITNQASALEDGNTIETNKVSNPVEEDTFVKDVFQLTDPTVSIDGKAVEVGSILVYTMTYTNRDDLAAVVTITDTIPVHTTYVAGSANNGGVYENGTLTWNLNLAAGQSKTVSFQVKVADVGPVSNTATALEGENTFTTNVVTTPSKEDTFVKDVFLAEAPTVSIDNKAVEKNDILVYKLTYTNADDFAATVTITDLIPEYTTYVEGSADNGGVYEAGKLTWTLNLAAGESKTVSFQVKVADTKITVENKATALAGQNTMNTNVVRNPVEEDLVSKDVYLESEPSISIDGKPVNVRDVLVYKITYTNADGAAAKVTITDLIPEYTTYAEGSADNGGVYEAGKLTWTLDLAAGESKTVSFKVTVSGIGSITNQASALEGENEIKSSTITNTVLKPELSIRKEQAVGGGTATDKAQYVKAGNTVTYNIIVTNNGQGDAYGVKITDKLPEGLKYVEGSVNLGGQLDSGIITWNVEKLASGESLTLSFKVTVPAVDENTTWTNVASVVSDSEPEPRDSNEVKIIQEIPITPVTGDSFNMVFIVVMMAVSACGLVVLIIMKRKEESVNA